MTVKDIIDRVPASRAGFVYVHELGSVKLLRAKDTPGTLAREVKTVSWATDEAGQNIELWLTMQPEPAEPETAPYGHMVHAPLGIACMLAALLAAVVGSTTYRIGRYVGYWRRVDEEKRRQS